MTTVQFLVQLSVVALAVAVPAGARAAGDPALRRDLEALSRRSVYFGHQSVGANIVDGLGDLVAQEGVGPRIVEVPRAGSVAAGTFAHGLVAENRDPLRKLRSFEEALGAGPAAVDIAFVKLCFVDVEQGTDVQALFARYQAALRTLQARHPRTTFVHVTTPLTVVPSGPKAYLKRLLGRDRSREQNARREELNALMRAAYQGREPLFDLARVEATTADGRAETVEWEGRQVPVLVPAYTDDGGHLDATGRRRVARELVALLAGVPLRREAGDAASRP